jgi:glyoxylase-like metal-dependent hydrolase (beta-lactamase superfamily II)
MGNRSAVDLRLVDVSLDRPGFKGFFGLWLVRGDRFFVVDAGPARSAEVLTREIRDSGWGRPDCVLLTHIHLDHAGGLSPLLEEFPGVRVICHRKAVPHLVDPARLWAGSRKVLGDMADAFGPLSPVPESALIPHDRAAIPGLGVIETPGHAPHHVAFTYGGCLFAGEAAGNHIDYGGIELLRPATPPRFYLEQSLASVDAMRALDDQVLCYAHFGRAENSREMLERYRVQLLRWRDILRSLLRDRPGAGPELCLEKLIEEDPELAGFADLDPETGEREKYFMLNSIHGYLGYLEEAG